MAKIDGKNIFRHTIRQIFDCLFKYWTTAMSAKLKTNPKKRIFYFLKSPLSWLFSDNIKPKKS